MVMPLAGNNPDTAFGASVDLSVDRIAVGSVGTVNGLVQTFDRWTGAQVGSDIVGMGLGDKLWLSKDGNILVSCSQTVVNWHRYNNVANTWDFLAQHGPNSTVFDIPEIVRVSSSDDGRVVALATKSASEGRIYAIELQADNTVVQRGQEFTMALPYGVWLSGDGNIMVVGIIEDNGLIFLESKRFNPNFRRWIDAVIDRNNEIRLPSAVEGIALSTDGNFVAVVGGSELTVLVYCSSCDAYQVHGNKILFGEEIGEAGWTFSLQITPDGSAMAVGSIAPNATRGTIQVYHIHTETRTWQIGRPLIEAIGEPISSIALSMSPNATTVCVGTTYRTNQNTTLGTVTIYTTGAN